MATTLTDNPQRAGRRWRGSARPSPRWLLLLPVTALTTGLFLVPLYFIGRDSFADGFASYDKVLASPLLDRVVTNTLVISGLTTVVAVTLAYVVAAALWRSGPVARIVILAFVLLPFWTGVVVKNFAWAALLQDNGAINDGLMALGIADEPLTLLHTRFAVMVGMVHYVLPYAVLPIFAAMVSIDRAYERAAASLGASMLSTFRRVLLPLTLPGVYAAVLLSFVISTGFYITPVVLGGPRDQMVANLVEYYSRTLVDPGAAGALALLVTLAVTVLVVIYQRLPRQDQYGVG